MTRYQNETISHEIELFHASISLSLETLSRPYFVPDDGLFDGGKGLEGRQKTVDELSSSDERGERSQLFCQSQQDLVLVVDGVGQERDQLRPGAFDAQSQSDRR